MPQIGWSEILVIVVLTIIIIGPKDIPVVLKKVGSWIGSFKRYINNIQNELSVFESENLVSKEDTNIKNESEKKESEVDLNVDKKK
jgi:sec-independent protein translocase protein TatB|tara:strand:+ start:307 stop:564 length:258 start_codon:yes stop_codon:yes gene_type:complete